MLLILRAGKDRYGPWLDVADQPFGDGTGVMVIRRVRATAPSMEAALEKLGEVTTFADIRPDLFRSAQ